MNGAARRGRVEKPRGFPNCVPENTCPIKRVLVAAVAGAPSPLEDEQEEEEEEEAEEEGERGSKGEGKVEGKEKDLGEQKVR